MKNVSFGKTVKEVFTSRSFNQCLLFCKEFAMAEDYGEKFGKFPLIGGETQGIQIGLEDVADLRAKATKCLVSRLGVPKRVNREAFKSLLTRIWRTGGEIFFKEINENLWLFEFDDEKDRNKVLEGRLWSYDRTALIIEAIEGKKPPSQMKLHHDPIWIQIHDMPLECMNRGVGRKIGESLGPCSGSGSGRR
jgi:hypothetical protein